MVVTMFGPYPTEKPMTEDNSVPDLDTAMKIIQEQAESIRSLAHQLELARNGLHVLVAERAKWQAAYVEMTNASHQLVEGILQKLEAAKAAGLDSAPVLSITPVLREHISAMRESRAKYESEPEGDIGEAQ